MTRKTFWLTLLLLPVLAVGLACGGDDDSDDGGVNGDGAPAATAASGGNGGGEATATTDSGGDDDSADDTAALEDCPELVALVSAAAAAAGGPTTNPDDADFEYSEEFFDELADRAPDEIKEDLRVFADAMGEYFAALEELDIDLTNPASFQNLSEEDIAKLEELTQSLDSAELQEASDNIDAYIERECS